MRTDWIFAGVISVVVAGLAAIGVFAVRGAMQPEPKISLRKADWRCTARHTESYVTLVPSGKITVPVQHFRDVCDRYERAH